MKSLMDRLLRYGACVESRVWVIANNYKTESEAWQHCPRADWMIWALKQIHYQDIKLRDYAIWCVESTPIHGKPLKYYMNKHTEELLEQIKSIKGTTIEEIEANSQKFREEWTKTYGAYGFSYPHPQEIKRAALNCLGTNVLRMAEENTDVIVEVAARLGMRYDHTYQAMADQLRLILGNPFQDPATLSKT